MNRRLELITPPTGTASTCRMCGREVIWDEVAGWLHVITGPGTGTAPHVATADWRPR